MQIKVGQKALRKRGIASKTFQAYCRADSMVLYSLNRCSYRNLDLARVGDGKQCRSRIPSFHGYPCQKWLSFLITREISDLLLIILYNACKNTDPTVNLLDTVADGFLCVSGGRKTSRWQSSVRHHQPWSSTKTLMLIKPISTSCAVILGFCSCLLTFQLSA